MRILGFSKKWDKLQRSEFTTFRLTRRDRDWELGEFVQIHFKPRSKDREKLGVAQIIEKGNVRIFDITDHEARLDGFENAPCMKYWLVRAHDLHRLFNEPMNKLTLSWVKREIPC